MSPPILLSNFSWLYRIIFLLSEVTLRLVRSDGVQVLCRSLHLGCSVDSCELYLYTRMDMEREHANGLHVAKQHGDKREQPRCKLRSALHVLRQTGSNRDLHGSGADSCLRQMRQRKKKKSARTCNVKYTRQVFLHQFVQCVFLRLGYCVGPQAALHFVATKFRTSSNKTSNMSRKP